MSYLCISVYLEFNSEEEARDYASKIKEKEVYYPDWPPMVYDFSDFKKEKDGE